MKDGSIRRHGVSKSGEAWRRLKQLKGQHLSMAASPITRWRQHQHRRKLKEDINVKADS